MKTRILFVVLAALLLAGLCACADLYHSGEADGHALTQTVEAAADTGSEAASPTQTVPAPETESVLETGSEREAQTAPETGTGSESETVPESTVYIPRTFTEEDFNIYLTGRGSPDPERISIEFMPDNCRDGRTDPDIRVWNSFLIRNETEIRSICARILADPLYDAALYGRTLESMVTEWRAHSDINAVYDNERTRHVDLDREDEGVSYADFWQRAIREYRR